MDAELYPWLQAPTNDPFQPQFLLVNIRETGPPILKLFCPLFPSSDTHFSPLRTYLSAVVRLNYPFGQAGNGMPLISAIQYRLLFASLRKRIASAFLNSNWARKAFPSWRATAEF